MPRAPKKCAAPDCETRVRGRAYCPEHTPVNWPTGKVRATTEHKAWRKRVLAKAQGVCQIRGPGCTVRAMEADHIIPLAEGGVAYDDSNGQALCATCHRAKTQQEATRGRRRSQGGPPPGARTN